MITKIYEGASGLFLISLCAAIAGGCGSSTDGSTASTGYLSGGVCVCDEEEGEDDEGDAEEGDAEVADDDAVECEDGVDAMTGAACVDEEDDAEEADDAEADDAEADGECEDGVDAVTGAACVDDDEEADDEEGEDGDPCECEDGEEED